MTDALIGKRIVLLRGELSQRDVAVAMRSLGHKWSQATVWNIERGERPLRLTEALDLSIVLDVALDEVAGVETKTSALHIENTQLRSHIARIRAAVSD